MDEQSSDAGRIIQKITMNKENDLIDTDDNDESNIHKFSTQRSHSTAQQQQVQRRVLLPALNPSRKLRTSATTTAVIALQPPPPDDITHSSSSMLTSSTTSNASLRTNSTIGSNHSSHSHNNSRKQQQQSEKDEENNTTLHSISNDTHLSISTTTGQPRVLRYGETVDSLFCLSSSNKQDCNYDDNKGDTSLLQHRQLCQQLCQGELANDAKSWCNAILMTLQLNTNNNNRNCNEEEEELGLGKRLIQLLRRATSRFKLVKRLDSTTGGTTTLQQQQQQENEDEILKLWLLYALVLVKYSGEEVEEGGGIRKNDAGQTYRHIQRLRFGGGGAASLLSGDFYTSLLVKSYNSSNNKNGMDGTTVEEVVRSLKETMDSTDTSLVDIFHAQWKQLEQCHGRNNDVLVNTPMETAASMTTAIAPDTNVASATAGGGRVIALPVLKGTRTNLHSIQREKTSYLLNSNNNDKVDDAEDTFDLKLKTARSKLEEGLKKSKSMSGNNNNKRSLLKSSDRSSKLLAARKKPRGTSGKLGAILSQSMHEDDDEEDEDDGMRQARPSSSKSNISPTMEQSLFQENISPIEAEPSTSIKDMDLDYLLSWDPTKRGSNGVTVVSQKKKKVTIAEAEDEEENVKQPVKKITRNDLGYMLNWEPFADRQKRGDDAGSGNDGGGDDGSSSSSSSASSSKTDAPPKRSVLSSTQGMSTIDEGTEGSIEGEENHPIKVRADTDAGREEREIVKQGNDVSRSGTDDQTDTSEKMIPSSQLDCSFLPLIENKNVIRVDGEPYAKLGVIGKGGSCKVYRALSTDCDVVALKKVKLDGLNKQAIDGYANEIALLKRLKGNPAIIQLYSSEVDHERKSIFLVMELGEVDLNYVLRQQELLSSKQRKGPGRSSLNMNFIRLTWQQMLTAVHSIHEERIIHSDLKPANFLFVRGALKLIDFGIAKAIEREDTTNVYRETLSGTLSYMSPEAIMDTTTNAKGVRVNKCGRPSDIWSLGCILYQMVYGKTPFADCHGIPQKVLAITNVNHEISYPEGVDESAVDAMKLCLQRNPKLRPPIVGKNGLLNDHYFLHGKTKLNQS